MRRGITQLRRRGATLEEVQLHLGHEDLSFTRRVYVHSMPATARPRAT